MTNEQIKLIIAHDVWEPKVIADNVLHDSVLDMNSLSSDLHNTSEEKACLRLSFA